MSNFQPNSFRNRLLAFYEANPDEELTHDDVLAKFGVSRHTVEAVLKQVRKSGTIEVVRVIRLRTKGIAK